MTAPMPTACACCKGERVVLGHINDMTMSSRPCPQCCCQICGKTTTMPPECLDCAADEESKAKRRADV